MDEIKPHLMLLFPDPAMYEGISTDPGNGGPWVMFPDTPYEHVMMPVAREQSSSEGMGHINSLVEENKELISYLFQEAINQRNPMIIDELYSEEIGGLSDQPVNKEEVINSVRDILAVFSELHVTVEDIIAKEDKVVTREKWDGTHSQTGKHVNGSVIHIFRIKDGKVVDEWTKGWEWLKFDSE